MILEFLSMVFCRTAVKPILNHLKELIGRELQRRELRLGCIMRGGDAVVRRDAVVRGMLG